MRCRERQTEIMKGLCKRILKSIDIEETKFKIMYLYYSEHINSKYAICHTSNLFIFAIALHLSLSKIKQNKTKKLHIFI